MQANSFPSLSLRALPARLTLLAALGASLALGGCAARAPVNDSSAYPSVSSSSATYGRIESIEVVRGSSSSGTGGAIVGGLVGGLLGNQVGGGTGRTAATVAGAVGGAVAGNQIEKNRSSGDAYQIGVRLDNGGFVTVTQDSIADLRVGDRISVQNNHVYRY